MPGLPTIKPDLQSREDVDAVVRTFYGNIEQDPHLGRFFAGVDWDMHLPKMTAFWTSVLFQTAEYHGRPFDPHAGLEGLKRMHFGHWLSRFRAAIDERFEGEAAERMKRKAEQIATIFQVKLGLWESSDLEP